MLAHIGKIPVEEWLPFLAPLVALFVWARRGERRRRRAIARLPGAAAPLGEATVVEVTSRWTEAGYLDVEHEQLPLLYPPGPDGATAAELAQRVRADTDSVERRLADLADLGYLELDEHDPVGSPVWLTVRGVDLVRVTEEVIFASVKHADAPPEPSTAPGSRRMG